MHERSRLRALCLAGGLIFGLVSAGPGRAETLDLEGTWYVLAHFRDTATANPDSDRWLDRVWVFTRKGSRLHWTEYPMVVFDDTTGRFEAHAGNARSRVLAAWEPNAGQLSTIEKGPTVGPRGSKTKSLRGSDDRGWTSSRRQTPGSAAGSTMVIGYQENVRIEGLDALPVFERQDLFGNATKTTAEGYTRYTVTEIDGEGRLHGQYERDGHQVGRFRMWRTPPVREPNKRGTSYAEKQAAFMDELTERAKAGDVEAQRLLRDLQTGAREERVGYGAGPEPKQDDLE